MLAFGGYKPAVSPRNNLMELLDIVVPTGVIKRGMTIAQAFEKCIQSNVPGIPFCGDQGRIEGRFSIRHIVKSTCIPHYMIDAAHLLGDQIYHATIPTVQIRAMLGLAVEPYILENTPCVSPNSPVEKALAIMEQTNAGYVFLLDGDNYMGVITRMGIVSLILKHQDELI